MENPSFRVHVVQGHEYKQYTDLNLINRLSKKDVLAKIPMFKLSDGRLLAPISDWHLISQIFPKNTTIHFHDGVHNINYCNKATGFNKHPVLQAWIVRKTTSSILEYPEIGMFFWHKQLRFVSCHRKQTHWIHKLEGLLIVFDVYTWFLLIISFLSQAKLFKHV